MVIAQAAKAIADHVRAVELNPRLTSDSKLAVIQQLNAEVEKSVLKMGLSLLKPEGIFGSQTAHPIGPSSISRIRYTLLV